MSKINKNDLVKALDELKDLAKGHNSRGTVTTNVETVVGESGATQVFHTPSNSNPRSWAGSTETDVSADGNTDSISENGTDYEAQAKMLKSIADKVSKGQALTKFEKSVLKAMAKEEKVSKAGAACAPGDDKLMKTEKAFPPKKGDDEDDDDKDDKKPPFVKKSLMDFAQENEEVAKGLDVSDFLANFADVMHKSQSASESRIKADILNAMVEESSSNAEFQKSLAEAVVNIGECLTAITQRLDQVESAPARGAKSVTNVQAINKGGYAGEGQALTKSQVSDALADLVIKGDIGALDVIGFESGNGLSPELENKVRRHLSNSSR